MWQALVTCSAPQEVAFCIPWFASAGGSLPIYWYGILASVGIFVGAFIAARHVEMEGQDPEIVWDALLWVLIAGLLGARLWYVGQAVLGGSDAYSLSRPLEILNPRTGGMNIFGGAVGGLIALLLYSRTRKLPGWLLADAGLLGLLVGQGIGRFGNLINQELYGPPTGSTWFGMLVSVENRLPQFRSLPAETRFHPTMLYEAFWLFLSFGVLYFIFRRNQERIQRGILTGAYLVMAGFGRFIVEIWRPDQPRILLADGTESPLSYSRLLSMVYVLIGLLIVLDRTGHFKIPFIQRPLTRRQRQQQYQEILSERRRRERALERDRLRQRRRRERERVQQKSAGDSSSDS